MQYAFFGEAKSESLDRFARLLGKELEQAGFTFGDGDPREANLVLSLVEPDEAKPFRRGSRGTYVLAVFQRPEHPEPIEESLRADYPMLLRALANLVLDYVPGEGAWFTTMERGHYGVVGDSEEELAKQVIERLVPLASSRLIIDNEFRTDLEPELWEGDEITESIREAGVRLGALNLLPNPFPIEDLLTERELRHVKRLYGIGGLSYGNLSARKDDNRFWMSASGVDKTKLDIPGRDILLVSDYDVENGRMVLSVPPGRGAATRVGRRDRALDDLPGAPRRRRDRPRPRLGGRDRGYGCELPVRHRGACACGRRARPCRGRSGQRHRRACGTTASRSPGRASRRSSTASSRACSPKSR